MTVRMDDAFPKRRGLYENGRRMGYRKYDLGEGVEKLNRRQRRAVERSKRKRGLL